MREKVIDCFMFKDELDLLEIRLNSMAPYVDRFVLCECPITHSGKSKPLYYAENKERFKDFNVLHLIWTQYDKYIRDSMAMDHHQRNFLMMGIQDTKPDMLVLLSDLDEIPNMEGYKGEEGVFKQKLYYYYLNTYAGRNDWRGTIAMRKKNIVSMRRLRANRGRIAGNGYGGWHFSTLGTTGDIIRKIEDFAHQELNTQEIKEKIAANKEALFDPYNRGPYTMVVEEITGPEWLVKNQHKYEHLIYRRKS